MLSFPLRHRPPHLAIVETHGADNHHDNCVSAYCNTCDCEPGTAQDLLWEYAYRRRAVDSEFTTDLCAALVSPRKEQA